MRPPGVRVPSRAIAPGTSRGTRRSPRRRGSAGVADRASRAEDRARPRASRTVDRLGVVDHRRHARGRSSTSAVHAVRRDDRARPASRPGARSSAQASASSIRRVPPTLAGGGDDVGGRPGVTSPQTSATPARGSSRRDSAAGSSVTTLAEREGEVLGQVRPGGVAAAAGQAHRDAVGGGGDGARRAGRRCRRRGGVAVQGEDARRRRRGRRRRSASSAPPGMTSSAGWKSSRTRAAQRGRVLVRPCSARPAPSSAARVHVVAAGVADAVDGRRPTGRPVRSPTGSASRSARSATRYAALLGTEVGDQAGAGQGAARGSRPRSSRSATSAVVRVSCQDSSGWACRSRRTVQELGARASTAGARGRQQEVVGHVSARLYVAAPSVQSAAGAGTAAGSEGVARDVDAPDLAQRVADLADGGPRPQRLPHRVEHVVGAPRRPRAARPGRASTAALSRSARSAASRSRWSASIAGSTRSGS